MDLNVECIADIVGENLNFIIKILILTILANTVKSVLNDVSWIHCLLQTATYAWMWEIES